MSTDTILTPNATTDTKKSNIERVSALPANNPSLVVKENLSLVKFGGDAEALEAVKQDPAVLKVHVTFDSSHEAPKECSQMKETLKSKGNPFKSQFEDIIKIQEAALSSLTPDQFQLLMKYVETLRRQRKFNQINLECGFCKNNGEPVQWYTSHALRSWRGRVLCPVLRAFRCPRCGATGDRAHTIKYCPENLDSDFWNFSSSSSSSSK